MPELAENAPAQESVRKNKRRRRILIFCVVSLLNVGLLVLLLTQLLTPAPKSESDPLVGHAAPNFSLAMLRPHSRQSALALSNFKGKPVVLNFWASWCDPCKEEAPLLESSWKHAQAQGKDVVFLGIDYQDSNNNGLSFLPNTAPESPCDSSMGMKGAFLIWGQGKRGNTCGFSALDNRCLDAVY